MTNPSRRGGYLAGAALMAALALSACQAQPAPERALPFPKGERWFNVSKPITRKLLEGRVTLLDFFTPGCINCMHMIPILSALAHHFGPDLTVISVDSPKFTASANPNDLRSFILDFHIQEPVLDDPSLTLWNGYGVEAWPTFILVNPKGDLVSAFVGETSYRRLDDAVTQILAHARHDGTLAPHPLPLDPLAPARGLLFAPGKIAVSGNWVAVSDSGDNRILLLSRTGKLVRIIGARQSGFRDGTGREARFNDPQGLAFGPDVLYVADAGNNAIRAIHLQSFRVTTIAGTGHRAYDVNGNGPAQSVPLNSPWALQKVGQILWIAMAGEHQIWKLNLETGRIAAWAGTGAEGIGAGPRFTATFAQPSGLAYHAGLLYDADPESSSVRVIHLRRGFVQNLLGHGLFSWGFKNGSLSEARLQHDQGLAYLHHSLYVADTFNNAIRKVNLRSGKVSTLATGLDLPSGLAFLNPETLLIANTGENRILALDLRTDHMDTWAIQTVAQSIEKHSMDPKDRSPADRTMLSATYRNPTGKYAGRPKPP
ncbi:MAG: thioredoxin-like domain-containing protein, partial [Gammaproteobacteria bacterium]